MVTSYWSIGQLIVEDEQNGNERAEYGKAVLEGLSKKLTAEFGKGFDESNLRYMRLFYQTFKNCDTLRHELTWSHYRMLLRSNISTLWQKSNIFTYSFLSELIPSVFFLIFMPQIPTASCYQPVHSIKERLIFIIFNSRMVKLFN